MCNTCSYNENTEQLETLYLNKLDITPVIHFNNYFTVSTSFDFQLTEYNNQQYKVSFIFQLFYAFA